MPRFVLLMLEDDHAWSRLPEGERERLLRRYEKWVADLRAHGIFAGGEPLGSGGLVLRGRGPDATERPYVESRQVPTGFFLIEAPDLATAAQIARGCPALEHGETVVVRPVGHDA